MTINIPRRERRICRCAHCGNSAPHELLFKYEGSETVYTVGESPESFEIGVEYFLTKCETCNDVSLYHSADYDVDDDKGDVHSAIGWGARLLYPIATDLPEIIPEKIRKTYMEAVRIKKIAPNAFGGQIRRALEYLCQDKGAQGKRLSEMISYLAAQGIIPQTLSEMTDVLRRLGNVSVHATEKDLDQVDVNAMDDFFKAILEYVYIAPDKITKYKTTIASKK